MCPVLRIVRNVTLAPTLMMVLLRAQIVGGVHFLQLLEPPAQTLARLAVLDHLRLRKGLRIAPIVLQEAILPL
jgi:hypothetical protein